MKIQKFKNEVYTDFSKPANRKKQEIAIMRLESQAGKEYPNIIGGERILSTSKFNSLNPSNPSQVMGIFQRGTAEDAIRALDSALKTFEKWHRVPYEKRAQYLLKAARISCARDVLNSMRQ